MPAVGRKLPPRSLISMGRRVEQRPENYNLANFREWVDRSRRNLRTDSLDLVQLHCPPTAVYSNAEVYDALDTLVAKAPSGTTASAWSGRMKPSKPAPRGHRVGPDHPQRLPAQAPGRGAPRSKGGRGGHHRRVPLASGLLSGKYTKDTSFAENDHRNYNRGGDAFDVGETFSGVDFELGLKAVAEFENWCRRAQAPRRRPSRGSLHRTASRRLFRGREMWSRPAPMPKRPGFR